jgi:SAM-dependent methyltransferase
VELTRWKQNWETLALLDPLWAILSDPSKKGQKWNKDDFFQSGKQHISELLDEVDSTGFPLRRGTALDFGCGVGRLTQALCDYFTKCYGVDISPTMVEQARLYNRFGGACVYVANDAPHLRCFESDTFDFIYTMIVLQHIPPDAGNAYIAEFVRIMKPEGLLIFQVPSTLRNEQANPQPTNNPTLAGAEASSSVENVDSGIATKAVDAKPEQLIDMYGIPRDQVERVVEAAGGRILNVQNYDCAGPGWISFRYWVTKPRLEAGSI